MGLVASGAFVVGLVLLAGGFGEWGDGRAMAVELLKRLGMFLREAVCNEDTKGAPGTIKHCRHSVERKGSEGGRTNVLNWQVSHTVGPLVSRLPAALMRHSTTRNDSLHPSLEGRGRCCCWQGVWMSVKQSHRFDPRHSLVDRPRF